MEAPHLCFEASSRLQAYVDDVPMPRADAGGQVTSGMTYSGMPTSSCVSARWVLPQSAPDRFVVELRDGDTVRGRIRVKQQRRRTCGGFGRCSVNARPPSFLDR